MVARPAESGPHSGADAYVALLGLALLEWGSGHAVVELVVQPRHTNALGRLHGGALFSLADAALARASNDVGEPSVVVSAQMQFLRATYPGDRLLARATEDYRGSRIGTYRVEVRCEERLVATASGQAVRVRSEGVEPLAVDGNKTIL